MKQHLFTLFLVLFSFSTLMAQYKAPRSSSGGGGLSDKIYFGGGGGFSGGTDFLNLSVSPLVGYKITERFSAGISTSYQFVRSGDFNFHNFGFGPFVRFNITEKFFAYSEYEYLNFELFDPRTGEIDREGFTSAFVGLGYTEPIGGNWAFNVSALYNLLYPDDGSSPYRSPLVFRVGIVAGLF